MTCSNKEATNNYVNVNGLGSYQGIIDRILYDGLLKETENTIKNCPELLLHHGEGKAKRADPIDMKIFNIIA